MKPFLLGFFLVAGLVPTQGAQFGDFAYRSSATAVTITRYTGPGGAVTIPDMIQGLAVTSIGEWAFSGCTSLSTIVIPDSVTSIGEGAFRFCDGLTTVTIPDSVTSIEGWAFWKCWHLTSITIGNSVTDIGTSAFFYCSSLTNVTVPNSVTSIGNSAFATCTALTSVIIGNSVTDIGTSAFANCRKLTRVCFLGNAPSDESPFRYDCPATVYYLPGTIGWEIEFSGRPTTPWVLPNPVILGFGPSFGIRTNDFGFVISWATNDIPVVVEACADPTQSAWTPVGSATLSSGSAYFSDPDWTQYPARFYRVRSE